MRRPRRRLRAPRPLCTARTWRPAFPSSMASWGAGCALMARRVKAPWLMLEAAARGLLLTSRCDMRCLARADGAAQAHGPAAHRAPGLLHAHGEAVARGAPAHECAHACVHRCARPPPLQDLDGSGAINVGELHVRVGPGVQTGADERIVRVGGPHTAPPAPRLACAWLQEAFKLLGIALKPHEVRVCRAGMGHRESWTLTSEAHLRGSAEPVVSPTCWWWPAVGGAGAGAAERGGPGRDGRARDERVPRGHDGDAQGAGHARATGRHGGQGTGAPPATRLRAAHTRMATARHA